MKDQDPGHITVLLQEAILGLEIQPGDIVVDGTLGSGGHTLEIVKRFGSKVKIIGFDLDLEAIERSKKRLAGEKADVTFVQDNFRNLSAVLDSLSIPKVNKILLDIGISSNQLEESGRGFSFSKDEPLQMTFKKDPTEEDTTAYTIVNEWKEETLATIIFGYGEERYSRRIAEAIVKARKIAPITTTSELAAIITEATPKSYHHLRIHPATKTFQALRIAVNDELEALKQGLANGFDRLLPEGRIAVISFHSLEDRIVKRYFRELVAAGAAAAITKKPITPSEGELSLNRRSRSAKLRIIKKGLLEG
jgi:16S rRNA (cytosine1402-N4)-methyltransferase